MNALISHHRRVGKGSNNEEKKQVEEMAQGKAVDLPRLVTALGPDFGTALASKVPARGSRFAGDESDVAMFIQRSKNQNVVCYRGTFIDRASNSLKPDAPIDAYWLDIDPEYVKSNRANGKMDDRCELNLIDRTMAYGHSVSAPMSVEWANLVFFEVSFVALQDRKMILTSVAGGTVIILSKIDQSEAAIVSRIFVKVKEAKHFWQLPSVEYVELHGVDATTGQAVCETIKS